MHAVVVLFTLVVATLAIRCPDNYCDNVKQPNLECKGGIRKDAGFCGCTDVCAKVEGEGCQLSTGILLLGVPMMDVCDEGLVCSRPLLEGSLGSPVCMNTSRLMVS